MQQSQLFRKKSMERISSPEQLQEYMRVTNPGIWMVLAAVILLLVGLLTASALVKVESSFSARGEVTEEGSRIVIEVPRKDGVDIREGMTVRLAREEGHVDYVYEDGGALRIMASLDDGAQPLPQGVYDVQIVTETLSPISFLLN